ncbi:InlB B-repeat-containing protein [Mangrovivirga cuniculi]|nr:InlB B-repeat-containing protein [Mangrovivirga cuniculi]
MNKYYIFLFALILGVSSCKEDEVVTSYNLTTQIEGSGSVSPATANVKAGETIEVTAISDEGFEFESWSGDLVSTDNPLSIKMDNDYNITANFKSKTNSFTLITQVQGPGSVTPETKKVVEGETIEVIATPEEGYEFEGWTGDIISTDNPLLVKMDKNIKITATFIDKTIDSDGDSVPDYLDQCENTEAGLTVDENGCAKMIQLAENGVTLYCMPTAEIGEK